MDRQFWEDRWQAGEIHFHQSSVSPALPRLWPRLAVAPGARVLVPLCGKSLDLLWLREQGFTVTGIELSRLAVDAFIAENDLSARWVERHRVAVAELDGIAIWCGDFFEVSRDAFTGAQGVFDRGSLIALPFALRRRYAARLCEALPADARALLLTVEYDQQEMSGPPFAVLPEEVHALFGGRFGIDELSRVEADPVDPRFAGQGVSAMTFTAYRLA